MTESIELEMCLTASARSETFDLVCFSHLRWDFVYQRPQHLLSRFAQERRVFFVEEPIFTQGPAHIEVREPQPGLYIVLPHLPGQLAHFLMSLSTPYNGYVFCPDLSHKPNANQGDLEAPSLQCVEEAFGEQLEFYQRKLLDEVFLTYSITNYVLWYYTPMALTFSGHLQPLAIIYDCMDELIAFKNAPRTLQQCEANLFKRADLVFTGGQSIYEAKQHLHPAVYPFPSSVDVSHFSIARTSACQEPADQAQIPHPRLGFFGVIDERLDVALLSTIADERPNWQIILLGPVTKIDAESLPHRHNIHYLGQKSYEALPSYLAGWDVALLPFVCNESTRFISPTKIPEYLAGGKPVISTAIPDVIRPYGQEGLVSIGDTPDAFMREVQRALGKNPQARWPQIDAFLSQTSWDCTWQSMKNLLQRVLATRCRSLT